MISLCSAPPGERRADAVHRRHDLLLPDAVRPGRPLQSRTSAAAADHGEPDDGLPSRSAAVEPVPPLPEECRDRRFRAELHLQGQHRRRADRQGPALFARARLLCAAARSGRRRPRRHHRGASAKQLPRFPHHVRRDDRRHRAEFRRRPGSDADLRHRRSPGCRPAAGATAR